MPAVRHHVSGEGPHAGRPGVGKVYRGSRKRVRRIKWWENTSVELWIFVVLMLFMLFVGIAWMIGHPPADHDHQRSELNLKFFVPMFEDDEPTSEPDEPSSPRAADET
jgi:hypothetical protein